MQPSACFVDVYFVLITIVTVILCFRLYHINLSQQTLKIQKIKEAEGKNRKWFCVCVCVCVCGGVAEGGGRQAQGDTEFSLFDPSTTT